MTKRFKSLSVCHYCLGPATTSDHIVPRSLGGSDASYNRVPACLPCNQAKANSMPTCPCPKCRAAIKMPRRKLRRMIAQEAS